MGKYTRAERKENDARARAVQGRRGKKDVRERAREKTTRRVERARDGEREKERKSGGESLALYK